MDDNADIFDEVLEPWNFTSIIIISFFNQVNDYQEEGPNKINIPIYPKTECNENAEEFQALRKLRLNRQREKLLKCINLLKEQQESETLIQDIIQ